ncbi:Wzy polymerase domain-containing protein [Ralstonia sp. 24A2]|uniref:PglL family O-oligosaccharyltransferase n=1 Tax=Ralstonia sp. 24A2 TaxID=3447364 RepID=UPI003F6967DF
MPASRIALPLLWFCLAASGSAPFLVQLHTYPITTFYNEFVAAACWFGVSACILGMTLRSRVELPVIALAPLGLIGALLLQLLVSTPLNPFFSFAAIVCLFGVAAVCGLGARSRELPGTLEALAIGLIIGAVATAGIETMQLLRLSGWSNYISTVTEGPNRRMWGNLNQPNHIGSYLAFGIAACLFLAQRYRRAAVLLMLLVVPLLWGMALTVSRTSWLLIIAIGVLAGAAVDAPQRGGRAWLRRLAPLLLLMVAYQVCNWAMDYGNVRWSWSLPGSLSDRVQQGIGFRPFLWNHAWHMFLAHPWLGAGWGDYAWNQYVQTDVLGHVEMATNAHNIVLDLLAKIGVVGLLVVAIPFLGLIRLIWRQVKRAEGAFLWTIIAVMGIHSMLEFPLHYLYFLLPFAFALGYLDMRVLRFPSGSMAWLLMALISTGVVVLLPALWSDYRRVEQLYYSTNSTTAQTEHYRANPSILLTPYATLAIAINANVTAEMAPLQAALEQQATQFYPGAGPVQLYALALALQGKNDEAVVQVRRLYNQYWTYYGSQSQVLTASCAKKKADLKEFCSRLKAENLLVESK